MVVSALDWVSGVAADGETVVAFARGERVWGLQIALGESDVYISEMTAEGTSLEQYFLGVPTDDSGPQMPSMAGAPF